MDSERNKTFGEFIAQNPAFATGKHRQLADFAYNTKLKPLVDKGELDYREALNAARDAAIEMLPLTREDQPQPINSLTGADAAIARMAIGRNQPIPAPSGRTEAPAGSVAQICAQHAGLQNKGD